ncbi:MAG: chemotaxis response regulator protein-glutamate methylesterase [Deltaproteobacteria bacterium]|nr:MAG: chemotaxis response regulator protein-glutamate methylesterase [Deltaproteobacteria bacterium]
MSKLRALVVDDTIVYRKIVSDVLAEFPDIEVVGTANNGKIALHKINTLKPDFITLDIEMPEMNGLETLEAVNREHPHIGVIMVSTLTHDGSDMTIRALELGAFDFIPKPQSGTMRENLQSIRTLLNPIVKAFTRRRAIVRPGFRPTPLPAARPSVPFRYPPEPPAPKAASAPPVPRPTPPGSSEIVAIGISTGGPNALAQLIPALPDTLNVPILIVQHMPPVFTQSLAKSLDAKSRLRVKEAENGEALTANTVYIAPGGKQMKVIAGNDGQNRLIRITDDPPENSCKPSADYLFRSVSEYYLGRSTGVIMTGMGNDGSKGLKQMKQSGAYIIAQDEATCTVFGMPKEPIASGIVDAVCPLTSISGEIVKSVRKHRYNGPINL